MKRPEFITPLDLYAYAKAHNLLNARIRICDGMAVSYYPDPGALGKGRYAVIIDISANDPIEFDDLDEYSLPLYDPTTGMDELDSWAQTQYDADRPQHLAKMRQNTLQDNRREYLRRRHVEANASRDPDSVPWPIYGYGPYRRRK